MSVTFWLLLSLSILISLKHFWAHTESWWGELCGILVPSQSCSSYIQLFSYWCICFLGFIIKVGVQSIYLIMIYGWVTTCMAIGCLIIFVLFNCVVKFIFKFISNPLINLLIHALLIITIYCDQLCLASPWWLNLFNCDISITPLLIVTTLFVIYSWIVWCIIFCLWFVAPL